jgi:hypothetical protein
LVEVLQVVIRLVNDVVGKGDRIFQLFLSKLSVSGFSFALQDFVPAAAKEIVEEDALEAVVVANGEMAGGGKLGQNLVG